VQVLDSLDTFFVEVFGVGSSVEVEVSCLSNTSCVHMDRPTTKDLVGTFTRENHLDSHSLDLSGQEVHGCGSSDGGDVESLQVVNDFLDGV